MMLRIGKFLIDRWTEQISPWYYLHRCIFISITSDAQCIYTGYIAVSPKVHNSMLVDNSTWKINIHCPELNKIHSDMFGDVSTLMFHSCNDGKEYVEKFLQKAIVLKAFL